MKIAYYTLDEVNQFCIRRWLKGQEVTLTCPNGRSLSRTDHSAQAIILDLDSLPAEIAADWLYQLRTSRFPLSGLVHGHSLTDVQASSLRECGITVCRSRVRKATLLHWLESIAQHTVSVA